jgi:hypothetical protein
MKFSMIITFALISLAAAQSFQEKNADDAEKLQKDFEKLTPDSPCKDGEQACVQDQFAQCVNGKFALNSCGGGELKCVVLPLVNKPGTSITCSTEQDRKNRLAAARGENPSKQPQDSGKGKDNNIETPDNDKEKGKGKQPPENDNEQPPDNNKGKGDLAEIRKKNADNAEKLQKDFEKLTPDSPCKDGEQACVENNFAQCVNGKFALSPCSGNLKCSVLPLVLKEGTTIACTTEEERAARLREARDNLK